MRTFNCIPVFVVIVLLAAACSAAPTAAPVAQATQAPEIIMGNPYSPKSGDSGMMRDEVTIGAVALALTKSVPPQVVVDFDYVTPTPCHKLRVEVGQPDAQKQIKINAYTVAEKNKACALMALATPLKASLNLGSFPKGHYSLWLNIKQVGEFDS